MPGLEPVAVVMAGGEGRRLWPASSINLPKQFLRLLGGNSLLEQTVGRLNGLISLDRVLVVTGEAHVTRTLEHLPGLSPENLIAEPFSRNTAPALALAAVNIRERFGDVPVVALPADHYVSDPSAFREALAEAIELVRNFDGLVAFGVRPARPETAYGYIEMGDELRLGAVARAGDHPRLYRVARFHEKPAAARARRYVLSGRYLWNAGLFVWRNESFLKELATHQPSMAARFEALGAGPRTDDYRRRLAEGYTGLQPLSVDYAVMEKTSNLVVMVAPFVWDDLGSWEALGRHLPKDAAGNVVVADQTPGCVTLENCVGCLVYSDGHPVALTGARDLIVAVTSEGALVVPRGRGFDIGPLVDRATSFRRPDRPQGLSSRGR